jgi:type IV pilus assembly protein PilB
MGFEIPQFFRGVGCRACRNTGYRGRIGVHELLVVDDALRDAILTNPTISGMRGLALEHGMLALKHDGFRKVREGITTVEEIFHIVGTACTSGGRDTVDLSIPAESHG